MVAFRELFANNLSVTVTSGGTTAPTAGTSEAWTGVSVVTGSVPAASSSASPPTAFRVVDPAHPSEWMLVTNVSGTTWTVTRGYEGATIAHSSGFTAQGTVTADCLSTLGTKTTFAVRDYGAVGDGVADDAGAFNAASTAAAVNGGVMYIAPGTYKVGSQVSVSGKTTVRGAGVSSVVIGKTGVSLYSMLKILGDDVTIEDLLIDGGGNTDIILLGLGAANGTTYNRTRIQRVHFTRGTHYSIEAFGADYFKVFHFVDNVIHDSSTGFILSPAATTGSQDIVVRGNVFRNITNASPGGDGYVRALSLDGRAMSDTFKRVTIANNVFEGLDSSGTVIPIEATGCTDIAITGNTIPQGSRGISTGWTKRMSIADNAISDQQIYAIELNSGSTISITGNSIDNCDTFVQPTNVSTPVTDVNISGNTITNSGYGHAVGNSIWVQYNAQRWNIEGNLWRDSKSSSNTGVIRIGNGADTPQDIVVKNNVYVSADSAADVNFISTRSGNGVHIRSNYVNISRAVGTGLNGWAVIYTSAAGVSNAVIQDNLLKMTGTLTATAFDGIDDGQASSYSSSGWEIRRNTCIGFNYGLYFLNNTSTDLYIDDNDTQRCLSADQLNIASRTWAPPLQAVTLASNYTTSSTSASSSNLQFSIGKNETWYVEVRFISSKATSNTGMTVQVAAPSGSSIEGSQELGGATFATAPTVSELTAINSASAAFATGIGVKAPSKMWFRITSGSTAGTVAIQFATVTSNTATVYAGSSLWAAMARPQ